MSRRRIFLFVSALVIAVAVVGAAAWVVAARTTSAQEPDGGRQALPTRAATSAEEPGADLEAFRARLAAYYGDLLELYPYIADFAPAGMQDRIVQAQKDVANLTPEQLAEVEKAFAEDPGLFDTSKEFLPLLERVSPEQGGLGPALEGGVASPGTCGTSVPVPALYAVKGVSLALDQIMHYLPQTLDVEVGLIIVVVTSMPHPAQIVVQIIKDVVDWTILGMEANNAWVDSCRGDLLEDNLDEKVSTRAAQVTVDAIDNLLASIAPRGSGGQTVRGASQASLDSHDSNLTDRANAIDGALSDHDDNLNYAVANLVEPRQLHLEVTQLPGTGKFLIAASDAGIPVTGVDFIHVRVAPANAASFTDVTAKTKVTPLGSGMYRAEITPMEWFTLNATLVTFEVEHNDHYGLALFQAVSPPPPVVGR